MAYTDIEGLGNKVENEGMNSRGRLSANEFNSLVSAVRECQGGVKKVQIGSMTPVSPDDDGVAHIVIPDDSVVGILSVRAEKTVGGVTSEHEITNGSTILRADNSCVLKVQYTEYRHQVIEGDETYTDTAKRVRLSVSVGGNYADIGAAAVHDARGRGVTDYATVDVSNYVTSGRQGVRVAVTDTSSGQEYAVAFYVVAANLELRIEDGAAWYKNAKKIPAGAERRSMTAQYFVLGNVEKTLKVMFYGTDNRTRLETVTNIATNDPSVSIPVELIETPTQKYGFFDDNGVRMIDAWVECSTDDGQTVESNHIVNNIIVVADESTAQPMVAVHKTIGSMMNYETATLFSWSMYNPGASGGGTSNVRFTLAGDGGDPEYFTHLFEGVRNDTLYDLSVSLNITASGDNIDVYVFAEVDGSPAYGSVNDYVMYFEVDNSVDYSPVPGADFYLNPGTRSNSETDPRRIVNAADGSEIAGCTFENMSFIDGVDGWISAEDGRRVFRVAAGGRAVIPYDTFSEYVSDANHHLTIEVDFACRNVTDEDAPMLSIGNADPANPKGVFMKPLNGAFVTAEQTLWSNADINWQEGVRTHVVFNVRHNYMLTNPDPSRGTNMPQTQTIAIVRTYINGIINREYAFNPALASSIRPQGDTGSIIIGQDGCDTDIYCIRIYKDTGDKLNLEPPHVLKNYVSCLPTAQERAAFTSRNDILNGGLVSFSKALAKGYNCIVWHGLPVNKNNSKGTYRYGYAEIYRHNEDGTLDERNSGTLYGVRLKGQGTTAMGYSEWNVQHQEDKKTGPGHDEYKYDDGGTLRQAFVDVNGTVGYGKGKFGYRLSDGDPVAKKLVGKINYASSMQSHKMGACNMYNDLYRQIVGASSMTDFSSGHRVTVKEEPFLYFVQRTEGNDDSLKVFQGLMTYGPGKADKPTWGAVPEEGDCMIEGAYNNYPLTDARVPFVDNGAVTYSVDEEAFMYAGDTNLDFGFGDTADLHGGLGAWQHVVQDGDEPTTEVPTTHQVKLIEPIWNFLYLCNVGIKPWQGTLAELNASANDDTFDYKSAYWMNSGAQDGSYSRYDLFRCHYSPASSGGGRTFVPAGIRLTSGGKTYRNFMCLYAVEEEDAASRPTSYGDTDMWYDTDESGARTLRLNLKDDLEGILASFHDLPASKRTVQTSGGAAAVNANFKRAITYVFRHFVNRDLYLNKASHLFHHEIMKLWAGTDNRSKNTYYRINPHASPLPDGTPRPNCEMNDDDLDTILKTNNAGIQTKPYYILEHDSYTDPADGIEKMYWEGQDNALNNTIEATYGRVLGVSDDTMNFGDLQGMMKSIYSALESHATSKGFSGTALATLMHSAESYLLQAQRYFPAVAYNETARIRYEVPAVFYGAENPAQAPLTQSLGDQYDSEREYIRRRLVMLAGYAGHVLDFQSFRGYQGTFNVDLVPHYYVYPMSSIAGADNGNLKQSNVRVPAGTRYLLPMGSAISGNNINLHFINELTDVGNVGAWGNGVKDGDASTVITFTSERLTSFKMFGDTPEAVTFKAAQVDISQSVNIESVDCHNAASLTSFYNGITRLMRLRTIDLRGTGIRSLALPQTSTLREVALPAGWETIELSRTVNLERLTFDGYASLTRISVTCPVKFDTLAMVRARYMADTAFKTSNGAVVTPPSLRELTLHGIAWEGVSEELMRYIIAVPSVSLRGTVAMSGMSFDTRVALIEKFGDISSPGNPLFVHSASSVDATSVYICGEGYFAPSLDVRYWHTPRGEHAPVLTHRRDVSEDAAGRTVKTYRLKAQSDSVNNVVSARWTLTGPGVDNGFLSLVDDAGNAVRECASLSCRIRCERHADSSSEDAVALTKSTLSVTVTFKRDGKGSEYTLSDTFGNITAYERKAKEGDIVYHDGWFDDHVIGNKACVGICFYAKENADGTHDRRMISTLSPIVSKVWGLSYNSYSGQNDYSGFQSVGANALKYNNNGSLLSPFDVPDVANVTQNKVPTTIDVMCRRDSMGMWRMYDADGDLTKQNFRMARVTVSAAMRDTMNSFGIADELRRRRDTADRPYYQPGDTLSVPIGMHDTLNILIHMHRVASGIEWPLTETNEDADLQHSTTIYSKYLAGNERYPNGLSTVAELASMERDLAADAAAAGVTSGTGKYAQFLYPAASYCYLFDPTDFPSTRGFYDEFKDEFKKHWWYCPSSGELARWFVYKAAAEMAVPIGTYHGQRTSPDGWTAYWCPDHFGDGRSAPPAGVRRTREFLADPMQNYKACESPADWEQFGDDSAYGVYAYGVAGFERAVSRPADFDSSFYNYYRPLYPALGPEDAMRDILAFTTALTNSARLGIPAQMATNVVQSSSEHGGANVHKLWMSEYKNEAYNSVKGSPTVVVPVAAF